MNLSINKITYVIRGCENTIMADVGRSENAT